MSLSASNGSQTPSAPHPKLQQGMAPHAMSPQSSKYPVGPFPTLPMFQPGASAYAHDGNLRSTISPPPAGGSLNMPPPQSSSVKLVANMGQTMPRANALNSAGDAVGMNASLSVCGAQHRGRRRSNPETQSTSLSASQALAPGTPAGCSAAGWVPTGAAPLTRTQAGLLHGWSSAHRPSSPDPAGQAMGFERVSSPLASKRNTLVQPLQAASDGGAQTRSATASRRGSKSPSAVLQGQGANHPLPRSSRSSTPAVRTSNQQASLQSCGPQGMQNDLESQVARFVAVASSMEHDKHEVGIFMLAAASALLGDQALPQSAVAPGADIGPLNEIVGLVAKLQRDVDEVQTQCSSLMASLSFQWEERFQGLDQRVLNVSLQSEQRFLQMEQNLKQLQMEHDVLGLQMEQTVKNSMYIPATPAPATNDHTQKYAQLGELLEKTMCQVESGKSQNAPLWQKVEKVEQDIQSLVQTLDQKLDSGIVQQISSTVDGGESNPLPNLLVQKSQTDKPPRNPVTMLGRNLTPDNLSCNRNMKLQERPTNARPAPPASVTPKLGANRAAACGQPPHQAIDKNAFAELLKRVRELPIGAGSTVSGQASKLSSNTSLDLTSTISVIPEEDTPDISPSSKSIESDQLDPIPADHATESRQLQISLATDGSKRNMKQFQRAV